MPETISVNCNNCGAVLNVEAHTRFVTCMHCGSKLEIKRDATAAFTDVIGRIEQHTSSAARDLEIIRLEQELERLDREQASSGHATANDSPIAKAGAGCAITVFMIMFIGFGISFAVGSAKMGAPVIFQIFGVGFAIIGVAVWISKASELYSNRGAAAVLQQRSRRDELIRRIEAARRGDVA